MTTISSGKLGLRGLSVDGKAIVIRNSPVVIHTTAQPAVITVTQKRNVLVPTQTRGSAGPTGEVGPKGEPGQSVVTVEQSVPAQPTAGNYQALSQVAIAQTPFPGTSPSVIVNGIEYSASSGAWRFQRGGQDVAPDSVQLGDVCIWRGAFIGFDIDAEDEILFRFEVST